MTEAEIEAYWEDSSLSRDSVLPTDRRLASLEPLSLAVEAAPGIDAGLAAILSRVPGIIDSDGRLRLQETADPAPLIDHVSREIDGSPGDGAFYLRLDNIRMGSLIGDRLCQGLTCRGEDEAAAARVRPVIFVNPTPVDELTFHRALQSRNATGFVYHTNSEALVCIGDVQNYLKDVFSLVVLRNQSSEQATTSKDVLSAGITGSLGDATNRLKQLCKDGLIQEVERVTTAAGGRPMARYRVFNPTGGSGYKLYSPPTPAGRVDELQATRDKAQTITLMR